MDKTREHGNQKHKGNPYMWAYTEEERKKAREVLKKLEKEMKK